MKKKREGFIKGSIVRETYLNKVSTVTWKAAFKPQERDNVAHTITLLNNRGHWYTSIAWLLTWKLRSTKHSRPLNSQLSDQTSEC